MHFEIRVPGNFRGRMRRSAGQLRKTNELIKRRKRMTKRSKATAVKCLLSLALALLFVPGLCAQGSTEATFKAKCAGCHGPDGAGATAAGKAMKVRDFHAPEVQKETDAELTDIVANGKNKMPKY